MIKETYFKRVTEQTPTRFWVNNATTAEAELAIEAGAQGCTQNPSYAHKMLTNPVSREHALAVLDRTLDFAKDDDEAQSLLQLKLVTEIAEKFMPLYKKSHGRYGYVTIQGSPFKEDRESILRFARQNCAAAPNIMAKVPAVPAGFRAMRELLRERLPVLATEVMSVRQAVDCMDIYDEIREETGVDPVFLFAHIPGIFDEYIASKAFSDGIEMPADYLWQAGVAVAKKIAALMHARASRIGFCSGGARGPHHFTEMVGAACGVTINWAGCADKLIDLDPPVIMNFLRPAPYDVLDCLCDKIPDFRKAFEINAIMPEEYESYGPVRLFRSNFETSWTAAREIIDERRSSMARV